MQELTAKERQFCVEYVACNEGAEAARRAKYSEKCARQLANRLLTKGYIKAEIERLKKQQEKRTLVDADFVILGLKEVAERCMQRKAVMVRDGKDWKQKTESVTHADGSETEEGVWEFDSAGANRSLELLGKHLDIFKGDNPLKDLLTGVTVNVIKNYGKHE